MADIKISEMLEAEEMMDDDYIPIVQNGNNKRIKTNKINKTKYILATVSDTQTISAGYEVNLNTVVFNNTSCILQDGKIKIGPGINKIKTSSSIFVDNWPMGTNYLWGIIRKNGSNICGSIESSTCVCLSCTNATMITDVQEGDLISLVADSPSGGNLRAGESNTFILIEVIS